MSTSQVKVFDRYAGVLASEKIYALKWLDLFYKHQWAYWIGNFLLAGRLASKLFALSKNSRAGVAAIPAFIKKYAIQMNEYETVEYKCFNDFFIRKFRAGKRPVEGSKNLMAAPAEARYLGWSAAKESVFVKGVSYNLAKIINRSEQSIFFEDGPVLVARLSPVDYHRFHFPDSGKVLDYYPIPGKLHSVHPIALASKPDILAQNERRVSILETQNFGRLAYIEVGAALVGLIHQTHDFSKPYRRGDEKGYFMFGASTVILIGEKGKWRPSKDVLENTAKGVETFVRLGDQIAGLTAGLTAGPTAGLTGDTH